MGDVTNYNNEIIKFLENLGDSKFDINKNIQGNKKELFTEDMKSLHMQKDNIQRLVQQLALNMY